LHTPQSQTVPAVTIDPKRTHVFLKNPQLVLRLRSEAARQDRSIRSIVTVALERYFDHLDGERSREVH